MHRKMGPRGLAAAQDSTISPGEVAGLRALKTSIVRAWRQGNYTDVTLTAKDGEQVSQEAHG